MTDVDTGGVQSCENYTTVGSTIESVRALTTAKRFLLKRRLPSNISYTGTFFAG